MALTRKNAAVVLAGAALLSMAGVSAAHAEGQFETYIKEWSVPKESSRWRDNNTSSDWTGVYFEGCRTYNEFAGADLKLYRVIDWAPDADYGSRRNSCGWVDWGDPDYEGQYYFGLSGLPSGDALWVDYVKVGW